MCVSDNVLEAFKLRETKVLELIKSYNIVFSEVGVFGSYARNDFKASSDIDFCIITESRPDRRTSGSLREEAELLGADIVYVTPLYFTTDDSLFARNLRRDYRRLL